MECSIDEELKKVISVGRQAYMKGFVGGSGGNISIRIGDKIYITATGAPLGTLETEDFVCMDMNGTIWNDKKPSKESVMHLECYKKRDDISCIIHLHPVYSIAATCLETADASGAMPVYTPGYALRINHIPMIPYMMPGSLELAKAVADVVESRNSLLLANHGVVAVGNNLESAMGLIEEIEENAQITFLLNGKGVPMTEQQIREIRMKEGRK